MDHLTQQTIDRLNASEYFTVLYRTSTPAEAEHLIRDQKADMAVVFSSQFANRPDTRSIQFLTDGTDPNTGLTRTAYAQQIIASGNTQPAPTLQRMLYNPQMKSAYNFVPGIMGMLLMLICAMMTSVSIAKEKERGTMEVLLVSPMRPLMIIIAKAMPYLALSLGILITILLMSHYILGVPLQGNIVAIFLVSMLYILLALSLGLLVSVVAKTQLVAMLVSGMLLLLPCILLSGMMYPIESMPAILQWVSAIMPARWFIAAIKKLMIMGVSWQMALQEITVMAVMTIIILTIALAKFKTRLE
jgi:ABC-2 type transport system permease protein